MRRIFPALFVVMLSTVIAGLLIFLPDELKDLGASLIGTTTFASNILFWMQADYFAGPVEFKPLLHTWSLAVEEQFYLFIPPIMYALHRWAPRLVRPALTVLASTSFAASCAWVAIDPSGNYYLPHTRAWELLTGSLLALGIVPAVRSIALNQVLSGAGLMLLVAPLFLLSEASIFPAWNALYPCLGAGLLIHTGSTQRAIGSKVLGFAPVAKFGLISYSLYLVHWPVIVFTKYQLMRLPTPVEKMMMAIGMVVLAWISWRFIERPFRDRKRIARSTIFGLSAAASLAAVGTGIALYKSDGLPQRFDGYEALIHRDNAQEQQNAECFLRVGWEKWEGDKCLIVPGKSKRTVLFWGDSHANQYVDSLTDRADDFDARILYYASAGCAPLLDVDLKGRSYCLENNRHALDIIRRYHVEKVVLSGYWQRIFELNGLEPQALRTTVSRLHEMGVKVAVIADNPDYPFANPNFLALRLAKRSDPTAPFYATIRNDPLFNMKLSSTSGADQFFNPMTELCRGNKCLIYHDGNVMMRDNGHLSKYGADLVLKEMVGIFD